MPDFLTNIPSDIAIVNAAATEFELDEANGVRSDFVFDGANPEFMTDIVRGFRLVHGATTYIEVGTRDKGNLGWLCKKLAPSALMIDIDIDQVASAKEKLLATIHPTQHIEFIEGNSIANGTIDQVRTTLDGRLADAIFLDSSHMYRHFIEELALYWPFLKPGGFMFVHDVFWEGNEGFKGKAQAFQQLNAVIPAWCICQQDPVHRFMLQPDKTRPRWGGLGLLIKPVD